MMGFCRGRPAGAAGAALGPALLVVLMVMGVLALPASAPAGPPQWARSWDPRPGYDVFQVRIAAAPTADIYVATTPCSPAHQPCGIAVARYSDAGKRLWGTLLLKSAGSGLAAVASDPAGNLVVAGYAPAAAGELEGLVVVQGASGSAICFSVPDSNACIPVTPPPSQEVSCGSNEAKLSSYAN